MVADSTKNGGVKGPKDLKPVMPNAKDVSEYPTSG
jgi:hypothetical protein